MEEKGKASIRKIVIKRVLGPSLYKQYFGDAWLKDLYHYFTRLINWINIVDFYVEIKYNIEEDVVIGSAQVTTDLFLITVDVVTHLWKILSE